MKGSRFNQTVVFTLDQDGSLSQKKKAQSSERRCKATHTIGKACLGSDSLAEVGVASLALLLLPVVSRWKKLKMVESEKDEPDLFTDILAPSLVSTLT